MPILPNQTMVIFLGINGELIIFSFKEVEKIYKDC